MCIFLDRISSGGVLFSRISKTHCFRWCFVCLLSCSLLSLRKCDQILNNFLYEDQKYKRITINIQEAILKAKLEFFVTSDCRGLQVPRVLSSFATAMQPQLECIKSHQSGSSQSHCCVFQPAQSQPDRIKWCRVYHELVSCWLAGGD